VALAVAGAWRIPWRPARLAVVGLMVAVALLNTVMKANVIGPVSERHAVDLPRAPDLPVTDGLGYIQGYVVGALEAPRPPATKPLSAEAVGWLPAYERIAAALTPLDEALGRAPTVVLATYEPLLNPNNVALAARLRMRRDLPVRGLVGPPGPPAVASYRRVLSEANPDALITVSRIGLSYSAATGSRDLDQPTLRRAARSLGYLPRSTVALPNARTAVIAWRDPVG
jgi:hypothetical protein